MGDSVVMQEAVLMLPRAGEACVCKLFPGVGHFNPHVEKKKANVEACGNAGFICEEANST